MLRMPFLSRERIKQQLGRAAFVTFTTTHGMTDSPTYVSWVEMRRRCRSDRHRAEYRDRGITVCERWRKFENFLADMGERPDGLTLDRIDNDGNYEPGNCRWATPDQQSRNRRSVKLSPEDAAWIRAGDGLITHAMMAEVLGVSQPIVSRIARGRKWRDELAPTP